MRCDPALADRPLLAVRSPQAIASERLPSVKADAQNCRITVSNFNDRYALESSRRGDKLVDDCY